ncbi:MAG: helix-turn-helix domain-containing protein [Bacteroidia bacterium]|nr:helix-turn-helix domain-containing protein [Bacteroidia bacterium]
MTKHYTKNNIGKRLNELRLCYGLSCVEFGFKCGVSGVAIYNLERGKSTTMKRRSIENIIAAYGTTKEWLLLGEGDMLPKGKIRFEQNNYAPSNLKFMELKIKNAMLEKETERLWKIIELQMEQKVFKK